MTISADGCKNFDQCGDALESLTTFLNQYSIDGVGKYVTSRSALGHPSLAAQTNLFSRKEDIIDGEECDMPRHMDPNGKLLATVRQRSYCYTTENAVDYSESASASNNR